LRGKHGTVLHYTESKEVVEVDVGGEEKHSSLWRRGGVVSKSVKWWAAHVGRRPTAPGVSWWVVAKPSRHSRAGVGARWPGYAAMGRRGPLAREPLHFSLNFEINTNFEIQNEALPDVQK
jgi:hypothetical protein